VDLYVNIEIGAAVRFSFGFLGPYWITDEDRTAEDWVQVPAFEYELVA
jgi:hypothetical protein